MVDSEIKLISLRFSSTANGLNYGTILLYAESYL